MFPSTEAVLLEARAGGGAEDDARTLALSHGSRLILERLGVWPLAVPPTPILEIRVTQRAGFGCVELTAAESGVPALGYVVEYGALQRALTAALGRSRVRVESACTALAVEGDAHAGQFGPGGADDVAHLFLADAGTGAFDLAYIGVFTGERQACVALVGIVDTGEQQCCEGSRCFILRAAGRTFEEIGVHRVRRCAHELLDGARASPHTVVRAGNRCRDSQCREARCEDPVLEWLKLTWFPGEKSDIMGTS